MFSGPTKEELEKDITRKETQLYDLRKQLEQHKKKFNDWMAHHESYPTASKSLMDQCESRIRSKEDEINNLRKKLLRMQHSASCIELTTKPWDYLTRQNLWLGFWGTIIL